MGDAADMLIEAMEQQVLDHTLDLCSDFCPSCRYERNTELRAPATIDELKDVEDD